MEDVDSDPETIQRNTDAFAVEAEAEELRFWEDAERNGVAEQLREAARNDWLQAVGNVDEYEEPTWDLAPDNPVAAYLPPSFHNGNE